MFVRINFLVYLSWDIFDFSSETAKRNSTKLGKKPDLNVLYQVCVFRADRKSKMATLASDWRIHFRLLHWNCWTGFNETWQEARSQRPLPSLCFTGRSEKTRWPPLPLISGDIFDFITETAERNSTKLSKISTSSTKSVFFRADWKIKMAALASDWRRHFRFHHWNCWTEFNETWQEARYHRPLPSPFSFSARKIKWPHGLWFAEKFSTSALKLLNGIQWNLKGSKISMSSTKVVFFRRSEKQGKYMYTQQKFYVVTFRIEISFKVTDRKGPFYISTFVFLCRFDWKRKKWPKSIWNHSCMTKHVNLSKYLCCACASYSWCSIGWILLKSYRLGNKTLENGGIMKGKPAIAC